MALMAYLNYFVNSKDLTLFLESHTVLGYKMNVASVEDVLQGKVWAYSDDTLRKSKRQKDLADIVRLIEGYPALADLLPASIRERIE